MALFLGVDGGGTKTEAVVTDAAGRVVSRGTAGSTNQNSVGADAARANLGQAVREALGGAPGPVCRATLAMSGVDRPGDAEAVAAWVREGAGGLLPAEVPVRVENDAVGALAAGTAGRLRGVVCISGTGHIAYGRNAAGESARAAGYGCLTDGGSGYDLGRAALRAVFAANDGAGPPCAPLSGRVLAHCGVARAEDLIGWVYSDLAFARVAGLAVHVFGAAAEGDAVAAALLDEAADAMAGSVCAVARRLGYASGDDLPVVAAGSVCQNEAMRGRIEFRARAHFEAARVVLPPVSSAVGAALLGAADQAAL